MASLTRLLALVLLTATLAGMPAAQAQPSTIVRIVGVDQLGFPDVDVTVSYSTAQGEAIRPPPAYRLEIDGRPVTYELRSRQVPVAVAIVTDLSGQMSDRGSTRFVTRFDDMLPLAQSLVAQLQAVADQRAALVLLKPEVAVAHELTHNLGDIGNTLNNANPTLPFPFAPEPAEGAAGAPYPLGEALDLALRQLATAPPEAPRALVLFAAGSPQQSVDLAMLQQALQRERDAKRPISVLIVGFGSQQPGEFSTLPAAPDSLEQLASDLGGTFVAVGARELGPALRREIDERFAAIVERGEHDVLRFSAASASPGEVRLRVAAGDADDTTRIELGSVPPRFDVVVDSRTFQDRARLSIRTELAQSPIVEVVYLIDNIPIRPEPQTNAPDFALDVDVDDPAFQQRFPPGEHQLTAAVRDASGGESRSAEPVTITVLAPPAASQPLDQAVALLRAYWWAPVIVLLMGVAAVALLLVLRGRRPPPRQPGTAPTAGAAPPAAYQPTVAYGAGGAPPAAPAQPDAQTKMYAPAAPAQEPHDAQPSQPGPLTERLIRWQVEVFAPDRPDLVVERVDLPPTQRHFDIGRPTSGFRPHIGVNHPLVSRYHAKIEYIRDELELIAGESANGTFYGEAKRPLQPHERVALRAGDVFWLSPRVKLRVVSGPTS